MSSPPMSLSLDHPEAAAPSLRGWWGVYCELGKARLSALVLMTTALGFVMADGGAIAETRFWATLLGTALAAWSASTFNQILESTRDARMRRTLQRPLPSRRIGTAHALTVAVLSGGLGLSLLAAWANPLTAALGALTIALYVGVYTPLKTRTTLNTWIGSVVGAIPPIMGWTAAAGRLESGALVLAAILFVWQIPHFLALAWLYREDYARGGFRMLPQRDQDGVVTGYAAVMWSLALLPATLAVAVTGMAGWFYGAGAAVLGGWLVIKAVRMQREMTDVNARRVFLATVIYLPLLMALMLIDRAPAAPWVELHRGTAAHRMSEDAVAPAAPLVVEP